MKNETVSIKKHVISNINTLASYMWANGISVGTPRTPLIKSIQELYNNTWVDTNELALLMHPLFGEDVVFGAYRSGSTTWQICAFYKRWFIRDLGSLQNIHVLPFKGHFYGIIGNPGALAIASLRPRKTSAPCRWERYSHKDSIGFITEFMAS